MKTKLPKEFNYAEAYLTLRCNLGCDYCINSNSTLERKRDEMTGNQWLEKLNGIDFGDVPLTIGGGEPTLHNDFFKIINGLDTKVDLLTNLNFDVVDFICNTSPTSFTESDIPFYHPIRVSYHVGQSNENELIGKTQNLRFNGFNVGIFGLFHPHNINENMKMAWECNQENVPFYQKDFLGIIDDEMYGHFKYPDGLDGDKKRVACRTKELLISPEGDIHKCHRDLYAGQNPLIDFAYKFRECEEFGNCNPCDVKLKTNKYLENIDCQVEVRR